MNFRAKSVSVDGHQRHLDIPTGLRGVFNLLGLKLTRLSNYPVGGNIYIDLLKFPPVDGIKTIFDVGANVGQTALEFNYYFPHAQIHSFEHASATFAELKKNTTNIPNIHCHRMALGPENKNILLNLQSESTNNSLNPIVQDGRADHTKPTGKSENVTMETIDSFCREFQIDRIDVMKVDAGGFDIEILRGGEELLKSGRVKRIFTEMTFDPRNKIHCQFTSYVDFLHDFKFLPVAIYDQKVTRDLSSSTYANALFSHSP